MLARHGLGGGLTISQSPKWARKLHPHLHAKLYAFAGTNPAGFIGSFNPSGDDPETDPDVIAEIGDQDRGHNMLVELVEPELVRGLIEQARFWRGRASSFWLRFASLQNRELGDATLRLRFFPRLRTRIVEQRLLGASRGDRIRGALSHVKPGPFTRALCVASSRGATVELIVHDTERRVPEAMLRDLRSSGIQVRRYRHASGLPVHSKYLLLEQGGASTAWFGSYNFNNRSRLINLELLAECTEPAVTAALAARFASLAVEVESQPS
jgi:phosphatidylserine/phosphatidylglycerophosphate/cardiolipin synthase-like enzyme